MAFELLNPTIRSFLADQDIHEPTGPQAEAIPHILEGENLLLVAPTGIGKTEAAMLPVFHLLMQTPGKGIKCIYITPLRALNRDMLRRLEEYGGALGIKVAVRHGDTSQGERTRQSRSPPDVLITTPETLQIMFTGKRLREHLSRVQFVVVDEIHELADDERGAQLSVGLERLVGLAGEFQRIGLSATVGTMDEIAASLGGVGRDVTMVRHDVSKDMDITIQSPRATDDDRALSGELQGDPELIACMRRAKELIDAHRSTLFFVNTRDTAEALALRYHLWDQGGDVGVHHGSLSKDVRMEMEDRFKAEDLKALICTSSLELGIDIGATDFAIQYNSPRRVARLIQRMGRAGHHVGGRTEGAIIASNADEIAEGMVIARRALAGEVEPLRVRPAPLTVLANQLVAMARSGPVLLDDAYATVHRSHPFRELERPDFDAVVSTLESIHLLFVDGDRYRRSRRGMQYFFDNISMIPDERTFMVRDLSTRKVVGTLDESFVASFAEPYATFITRGRTWRILEVKEDELLVEQVNEIGSIPSWVGEDIPVPCSVAQEVGRLRRTGDMTGYTADADSMSKLEDYLQEQRSEGPMPSDRLITIEIGKRLVIIHSCSGSRVNMTLSKLLSVLLTARLGESVGVTTDPYRIILELPRDLGAGIIVDTLRSIDPGSLGALIHLVMRNSSHLRWRFVYVAKKFGVIDRDADYRAINMRKLFDIYEGTPVCDEALAKVMWEDLAMEDTAHLLRDVRDGRVSLEVTRVTTIGRAGLSHSKELIQPQRANRSILMALKHRLEGEVSHLTCLSCRNQWRMRVADAPPKAVCPRCGGRMVATLPTYDRDKVSLLDRRKPTAEELKDIGRLSRNANLVREYGPRAIMTLAGRGIGPDTAARILSGYHDDEEDLLRDILAAEIQYAKTKRFWD